MENRDHRQSEELAASQTDVPDHHSSRRKKRRTWRSGSVSRTSNVESEPKPLVQDPRVEIRFEAESDLFQPSDFLSGDYSVYLEPEHQVQAIEASVIWMTAGKGQEDIGAHFFQRKNKTAIQPDQLSQPTRFSTVLPASPLSYSGKILKIIWCVRVRLFMVGGREITFDREFQLSLRRVDELNAAKSERVAEEPTD